MTENKLVDDAPEACPSLADTAAAVAEGQIAQALCGETLCPLPAEEGYRFAWQASSASTTSTPCATAWPST